MQEPIICSPDAASKLCKDLEALLQDFGLDWQHELVDCVVGGCAGILAGTKICSNALQVLDKVVVREFLQVGVAGLEELSAGRRQGTLRLNSICRTHKVVHTTVHPAGSRGMLPGCREQEQD